MAVESGHPETGVALDGLGRVLVRQRLARWVVLAFALVVLAILASGLWFYQSQRQRLRRSAEEQVSSVARLKVKEIANWRAQRLGDAASVPESPFFEIGVNEWMATRSPELAARILSRFQSLQRHYHYSDALIAAPDGSVLLSASGQLGPLAPEAVEAIREAMREGKAILTDVHFSHDGQEILLDAVGPIFEGQGSARRPVAAIVLVSDASQYLYPLIQSWPVPSHTAESLLIRRDGDDVLFLNELRHRTDTALKLRIPLSRTEVPAVQAALDREGVLEGNDYRGVRVVSAAYKVPDSPWSLVAKVDAKEVYAPLRQQAFLTGGLVLGLILAATLALVMFWRRHTDRFYREIASNLERRVAERTSQLSQAHAELEKHQHYLEDLVKERTGELADSEDLVKKGTSDLARSEDLVKKGTSDLARSEDLVKKGMGDLARSEDLVKKGTSDLAWSEEQFRATFEQAAVGLAHMAPDGRWLQVNQKLCDITGYSRQELLTKNYRDITCPEDLEADLEYHRQLLAGEMPAHRIEKHYICKDGALVWVNLTVSLSRQPSGEPDYFISVVEDISERKRREEELTRTLADLERSNKELEQFAYVASHDLQEPLRMVSSYTQLLGERYHDQLDEKAKKYIDYAVEGATRMQRLTNDLLLYARVGTRGTAPVLTDSHAALGEALSNLFTAIQASHALITNDDLPDVVADALQLVQLFQNLIGNAIKFHGEAQPRVHISAVDQGRHWLFSVRDNGIGIEPQYHDKVFVIFQRLHTRQGYPGTGIGLALCKSIVERHRGTIWFESEPGKGSTFFFTWPK